MKRSGHAPAFVRPAILEAVLLITSASAAVLTAIAGNQMQCTALVEFAILSAITATSAGALFLRYAVEICGFLADYRRFEKWGARLRTGGYAVLGIYALLNGVFDITVPRREPDWVSYSGLLAALVTVVVFAFVLQTKYRVLESLPSRSLADSLSDDTFYLTIGVITLPALVAHAVAPSWWFDTVIDAIFLLLIGIKMRDLHRRAALLF